MGVNGRNSDAGVYASSLISAVLTHTDSTPDKTLGKYFIVSMIHELDLLIDRTTLHCQFPGLVVTDCVPDPVDEGRHAGECPGDVAGGVQTSKRRYAHLHPRVTPLAHEWPATVALKQMLT